LADALRDMPGIEVTGQHTSMVFIDVPPARLQALKTHMDAARVRLSIGYTPGIRMVLHMDVDDVGVQRTVDSLRSFFTR
jgi:threonine aldolase